MQERWRRLRAIKALVIATRFINHVTPIEPRGTLKSRRTGHRLPLVSLLGAALAAELRAMSSGGRKLAPLNAGPPCESSVRCRGRQ